MLLQFVPFLLALHVQVVQREDTVCDEVCEVLGEQLGVVKHAEKLVEVTTHHYEVERALKVEARQ